MEDKNKSEIINQYRLRFIRWQQLTQTQISNTNNLILALTTGLLTLSISKLDLKFPIGCHLLFFNLSIGYLLLLTSILTGLLLTFNRLNDFRKTTEIIKYKRQRFETENGIKNHGDMKKIFFKIDSFSSATTKLGQQSWCLLRWQLLIFLLGSIFVLIVVLIQKN